jgi:hypothetical protein
MQSIRVYQWTPPTDVRIEQAEGNWGTDEKIFKYNVKSKFHIVTDATSLREQQ